MIHWFGIWVMYEWSDTPSSTLRLMFGDEIGIML
jgi:hypothetical protein